MVVVATSSMAAAGMRSSSPFAVSQWQELEHQALILKYLMAGLPVPPDLVLPIQKSFDSMSARFFHQPTRKKVDSEPGRCQRTDGKKWRCSKDAYPDSKYCERHMHCGRNRSRKPVESLLQADAVSQLSSSNVMTSLSVTAGTNNISGGAGNSLQNHLPLLHTFGPVAGTNQSQLHQESITFGIPHSDYGYRI